MIVKLNDRYINTDHIAHVTPGALPDTIKVYLNVGTTSEIGDSHITFGFAEAEKLIGVLKMLAAVHQDKLQREYNMIAATKIGKVF